MSDSPVTTNGPATVANQIIHALIFDVAVKAAEAAIIEAVPFLGLPGIKQIDEALIKFIAEKIYEQLAIGVTFSIIDIQVNIEAFAVKKAAEELRVALGGDSLEKINEATKKFEEAFGKLIHYNGSANP